jgi:hypothetical protein
MCSVKTVTALLHVLMVAAALFALAGCNLVRAADAPVNTPSLSVAFQEPANMTQVRAGDEVQLLLLAEDRGGAGVARVDLLVDDRPHQQGTPEVSGAVPVFTVQMRWRPTQPGLHSLTAVAYREDGTASAPATIVLEVVP